MGLGKYIAVVTQMRTAPLAFIVAILRFLFCVGLCPHETYLCRTRGCIRAVGEDRKTSIAWTRVHAIINQETCSKSGVSGEICDLPGDTWTLQERPICIRRATLKMTTSIHRSVRYSWNAIRWSLYVVPSAHR